MATLPHTIRLRHPWQIEPLSDSPRHVRCTRHFHKPTGLGGGRVWLVVDAPAGANKVILNGVLVGQASRFSKPDLSNSDGQAGRLSYDFRYDITTLLAPRNQIEIELPADAANSLPNHVRLEIE